MDRTANRPPLRRKGIQILRKAGFRLSVVSLPLCALLLIATYARAAAVVTSVFVFTAGFLEWLRGRHRLRKKVYRPLRKQIETEVGLARLQMLLAPLLMEAAFIWSPALVVGIGFALTFLILFKSAAHSGPLSEEEERRGLLKLTAAEECALIGRWADIALRVRQIPVFRVIPVFAHREGPEEHISALRTSSMMLLFCASASYLFTGVALGVTGISPLPNLNLPSVVGVIPAGIDPLEEGGPNEPTPTYAELCSEIPNPLSIGHQLGPLFRRDGAIKAGCAVEPIPVAGTGTWAAPGMCEGRLRSLAASAPGRDPAIVYGTPAEFAWIAAQTGDLVALEVAEPNEGDVYLVVTRSGTYGFARPTRSLERGPDEPKSCSEVGGVAQRFVKLEPVMVNLWVELMEHRAEWVWPKLENGPKDLSFTDRFDATLVAAGGCNQPEFCRLETEGQTWPQEGSGFASMAELAPYMPPPAGS